MRRFFHIEPTAPSTRFGIGYIQELPFPHALYPKTDICHRNIKFHFLSNFGRFIPLGVSLVCFFNCLYLHVVFFEHRPFGRFIPLDRKIRCTVETDNSSFSASIATASKSGLTMNFVFLYLNVLIIAAD